MGFASLIIKFRPTSNRIPEYHHFEERKFQGGHNSRRNRWFQWCFLRRKGSFFWAFCSSRLILLLKWDLWMNLFSAEATFASSTSKSGIRIPLTDNEDLKSSTESTISTFLIHSIASVGNCEQAHTSVLNLIFQQANVGGVGNLSKSRTKDAIVLGLPHDSLNSLPHVGWLNFWLTVRTGIADLELVFGFHSSPSVRSELVLFSENPMISILADKVLKKTKLDLQKRFPMYHACPKYLPAHFGGSAFLWDGFACHQELDEVGKTQVDCQRGNVHCVLIQHLENLSNHSYNWFHSSILVSCQWVQG